MYENELQHHGVKGMKWGHRKKYYNSDGSLNSRGQARQDYKDAKKNLRKANKELDRASFRAVGVKGIQRYEKANKVANDAYTNMVSTKAKYKASSAKNAAKAEKAEYKVYKKEMEKHGIRGSYADAKSGGASTALYNKMKAEKGKAYADKIEKRVQNEAYATIAAGAAVMVGQAAVMAYLESRG